MALEENSANSIASTEEVQREWRELKLRLEQLEADKSALQQETKALRFLLERVIEHRQKSHGELVLLLSSLVSKLPINDVGATVARLVEHNTHVNEVLAGLVKGRLEAELPQPAALRALAQTRRDLLAALKLAVNELIQLDTPLEADLLHSLAAKPELFFSPRVVRATRGFLKGQVPRDRIVTEFGEQVTVFFNDVTTDRKLNPRPHPDEIMLAFKPDFEAWFKQNPDVIPGKRKDLQALYEKVQRSKSPTEDARAQKNTFVRLSFILELIHYYDKKNTEAPDVIFAQRLPALIEQLVLPGPQDRLEEKLIRQAEVLLALVVNPDYRQACINNLGKGGSTARTLKYVFKLRADKVTDSDAVITEFVKHLLSVQPPPPPQDLVPVLQLIKPDLQKPVVHAIMDCDRLGREPAEALGRAVGKELGLTGLDLPGKALQGIPPETERQIAWGQIRELIVHREEPAMIVTAIRERLHTRCDADELKQSWLTLIDSEPIALIRIFCLLPYLPDGETDSLARPVMSTYVSRLVHEKYAATYHKVLTSLKNMYKANPKSPLLLTFIELVHWVDDEAAKKLTADIGLSMPTPAS